MPEVKRIFVEKKRGFDTESVSLLNDLKNNLRISNLTSLRIVSRYDVSGLSEDEFSDAVKRVFSEPPVDHVHFEELETRPDESILAVEYLPGQYDQRGDSASQAVQILTLKERPSVRTARVYVLAGALTGEDHREIRRYLINPVDSREASPEKPVSLEQSFPEPGDVRILEGFAELDEAAMEKFRSAQGLAMSGEDLLFIRDHFRDEEKRDPSITEVKILDTYWSDHCRHTTFETAIRSVNIESGHFNEPVKRAYEKIKETLNRVYGDTRKELTLMSMATLGMKSMKKAGRLEDLEVSAEINACSIRREVTVDGRKEPWLIMFKNETHNHPTEIEPFGGSATCLGGAIRDPLSGRAYVYQAMRVTGSGNPGRSISETIPGKLPQRKITTEAARGYSSYGNQIGLATGKVFEIYDEGYVAKRMEVGAVIGAVPESAVMRGEPAEGDLIVMIGGMTGRDGIGGATGSSKGHDENSIFTAGAEVQKGNPPEERKLQRLFRNPGFTKRIKRSNDFGAGGVSVAIGELARGLSIDLDRVPKKYEGLDGTELALSESQERMAVVINKNDLDTVLDMAMKENLSAVKIAEVTGDDRLKMVWRGGLIADISRKFLDTNGVRQRADVTVTPPSPDRDYFKIFDPWRAGRSLKDVWTEDLAGLNRAGQKGLTERFDSSIGAGTVLMPLGGSCGLTEIEAMAAKIPVTEGETSTVTIMSFGFNPRISSWSPFHGAYYSVIEAVSRIVATGGNPDGIRTSLQEYFEKLGNDRTKWGKPFAALCGAFFAHDQFGIAAVGGKDSMSGSFMDLNVPPTLITFAVQTADVKQVISPEFKHSGNRVYLFRCDRDEREMPDIEYLKRGYSDIHRHIGSGNIISAASVREGGIAFTLFNMCAGNKKGFVFGENISESGLFSPDYGSIVFEASDGFNGDEKVYTFIGEVTGDGIIEYGSEKIELDELLKISASTLESVFPVRTPAREEDPSIDMYQTRNLSRPAVKTARPRIVIPVFPGTNCEYDTAGAFESAGGIARTLVFNNLTPGNIRDSIDQLSAAINDSQIIAIPGGFSAGDEPDGSGKFITAVFRNPLISDAVAGLLQKRDGLMLGICNGFQALIKLGLVPYGEIRDLDEGSPTLTFNAIGRHVSTMVRVKTVSVLSPWFMMSEPGDIHIIPVSHGEGRFSASPAVIRELERSGQIATQYVDHSGNPSYDIEFNPNGSDHAVESITSPDGRVLGRMGHPERITADTFKNIPGIRRLTLFGSGVNYFR